MIRNTVEFKLGEKIVGFRTGTMALSIAVAERRAENLDQYFHMLANADLLATQALFYGSAYQYAQWKGLPIDFNMTIVSEWIEDLGEDSARVLTDKLLESYAPKNLTPPANPGGLDIVSTTGNLSP